MSETKTDNAGSEPQKKRTVLIVDDEPSVRDALRIILEFEGYSVIATDCSTTALNVARHNTICLVISDIARPDINGLEFTWLFKRRHPDIPVLVCSAGAEFPGRQEEAKEVGVDVLLPKPIHLPGMRAAIGDLLL